MKIIFILYSWGWYIFYPIKNNNISMTPLPSLGLRLDFYQWSKLVQMLNSEIQIFIGLYCLHPCIYLLCNSSAIYNSQGKSTFLIFQTICMYSFLQLAKSNMFPLGITNWLQPQQPEAFFILCQKLIQQTSAIFANWKKVCHCL